MMVNELTVEEESKVLATIDGEHITKQDLDRIVQKYPVNKRIYFETPNGFKQLLEQKIAFKLLHEYGKQTKLDENIEFVQALSEMTEQLMTQFVMRDLFAEITVSDAEIKAAYEVNKEQFCEEEMIRAKHILVEELALAEQIEDKINTGVMTFEEAVKAYSICPSKEKEGDLGFFKRGMMVKEFEDVAFDMQVGEKSNIVPTQFGFHLIQLEEKTEKRQKEIEEVKEMIAENLKNEKQQQKYEALIGSLKEEHKVELFE